MKGKEKTKEQLQNELMELRQQITELQKSEIKHRQIEKTLGENVEKYRILVEMAADGILIETVEGRILECNTAGAKMFGYNKKDMIGLTMADRVPEEFAKKLPKVITDKEINAETPLAKVVKSYNLKLGGSVKISRNKATNVTEIPASLRKQIFATKPGAAAFSRSAGGFTVVHLQKVLPGQSADNDLKDFTGGINSMYAEDVLNMLLISLEKKYKPEINERILKQI